MFTRTAYCSTCYNASRPRHDDLFAVYGTNSRHFIVDYADHTKRQNIGFTPHNFELLKYENHNKTVIFQKFCGICGVHIYRKKMKWELTILKLVRGTMSIQDWQALQRVPNLGYHI